MPLYDYKCSNCGPFELWRRLEDLSQAVLCPTCQGDVSRIFSPPMVLNSGQFPRKGSSSEPRLVQSSANPAPETSRLSSQPGGRPWMISH